MDEENLEVLIQALKELELSPRIPEPLENLKDKDTRKRWVEEKNAVVYTVMSNNGMIQIDIFLAYPISFQNLKNKADVFKIDGVQFYVSSKKDLIYAKQQVHPQRKKDIEDIASLEELLNDEEQ